MPVNGAFYPMVHEASRLDGFIVGSIPRKKLVTKQGERNQFSPAGLLLARKGITQPRRFMQKELRTHVKRVRSVLNTFLERYFQSLP
jgi:hypothetical protein